MILYHVSLNNQWTTLNLEILNLMLSNNDIKFLVFKQFNL